MSLGKKQGIKAFELADELGVKPGELLRVAREMGLSLQNRLTRMDHPSADRLRAHLAAQGKAVVRGDRPIGGEDAADGGVG